MHANTVRDKDAIWNYYRRLPRGSGVFKCLEFDGSLLTELRSMGVTIIGRNWFDNDRLDRENMSRILELAREYPQVHYWEGHNESHQWENEIGRYAEWEIARMDALDGLNGPKAIIGNFSCGQPQLPDGPSNRKCWPNFRPALDFAMANGHALGLHEYSGPMMQWMTGDNQWDWARNVAAKVNDPCLDPKVLGYLCLRYRRVYALLREWGLGDLPLFITEGGVDDVNPRPGPQGKGYKDYKGSEWENIPGIGDYAQQRRWYMWQVSHDIQVKGVVDFGWDTEDQTWEGFNLKTDPAMLERVITLESDLPVGHFEEEAPVADRMLDILKAEFGDQFHDYRGELPQNPNGRWGPFGRMGQVKGIAAHHTAGPKTTTWASIAQGHITSRGFAGIGYHIGIRLGEVGYLGAVETSRAHVTDQNDTLIGVVLGGNYMTEPLDARDADLFRRVVKCIDLYLGREVPVKGHGTWHPQHTVCPGTAMKDLVAGARSQNPAGELLVANLRHWADLAQAKGIQPNPTAALYDVAEKDGFYPLTDESGARDVVPKVDGTDAVAQLFRRWKGTEERIYYWLAGQVKWIVR